MSNELSFFDLREVAQHLREKLAEKKYIVLFAYNGTGKTRLSMEFKNLGRKKDERDTLYFNAFTEDLFYWNNDLERDEKRVLCINQNSRFFDGLWELEMESRIRPLLQRYADFDFKIHTDDWTIHFNREVPNENGMQRFDDIKVSRGEENIFIWCFFLAVAQLAIDQEEGSPYQWVKYIYVDDPISSLDDNNVIAVASHLAQLLKNQTGMIKTVISSHHALFFNVIWNELNGRGKNNPLQPYFLSCDKNTQNYVLCYTQDIPFFHHVALLKQLNKAAETGRLFTYHFNILRSILEKTATFHGFKNFSACIQQQEDDPDGVVYTRMTNVLSHGNYSLFEPQEMLDENKQYFKQILTSFMRNYRFNPELFSAEK